MTSGRSTASASVNSPDHATLPREHHACPLCGETETRAGFEEATWTYRRCTGCRLLRLDPRPTVEALDRFYQEYLPVDDQGAADWQRLMAGIFRHHRRWLEARTAPGRLLDVGCGHGYFLEEMARGGWDVTGADLCAAAVEGARSRGFEVMRGGIDDLPADAGPFDVITAFYVIEHVPDPPRLVRRAFELLRPGGILVLRWPNTSPVARVVHPCIGDRWRLFQAPAHLFDFSPRTMRRLLEQEGFERLESRLGGWTLPPQRWQRVISRTGTWFGEALGVLTLGRVLLPGVSRSTLARRPQ